MQIFSLIFDLKNYTIVKDDKNLSKVIFSS